LIAVAGEAFGFGPASKSVALVKQLGAGNCVCFGTGTTFEFFRLNGYDCTFFDNPPSLRFLAREVQRLNIDRAVISLDVKWAERFIDLGISVFYVDSLGFMWGRDHIQEHSRLYERATYVCQDVLGAYRSLDANGAHPLIRVGAIVDLETEAPSEASDTVVNIGGVFTPRNEAAAMLYLDWVAELVIKLSEASGKEVLILSSQKAVDYLRTSHARVKCECLPHALALGVMAQASTVLTAPGLTAMLELSALGARILPLPPQNYSQCRIVQECLAGDYVRGHAWHILASEFPVPSGLPEPVGIEHARLMMASFAAGDRSLLLADAYSEPPQPVRLTDDFTGAKSVAAIVGSL
jgi:hypothetical protein